MEKSTSNTTVREIRNRMFNSESISTVFINNRLYSLNNARRLLFEQKNQDKKVVIFPSEEKFMLLIDLD